MPIENLSRNMLFDPERLFDRVLGERSGRSAHCCLAPETARRACNHPHARYPWLAVGQHQGISALLWLNPTVVLDGKVNLLNLNQDGTGDESPGRGDRASGH